MIYTPHHIKGNAHALWYKYQLYHSAEVHIDYIRTHPLYYIYNSPVICSAWWTILIPLRVAWLIGILLMSSADNLLLKETRNPSESLQIIISSNTSIDHGCAPSGSFLTTTRPVPSKLIVSTILYFVSTQYNRFPGKSSARPLGQDMEVLTSEVKSEPSVFKLNIPGLVLQSEM